MRIGSLFSGIGGLELGLERAGLGPVVWQVEREAFPRSILAKHWPNVDRSVTDVCEANASNLAPVDLICGGFPCQDISSAGKRAGIVAGKRSGLWREYARIVRVLRPRFVFVENVAALLVRGLDRVLGDLAGLGYDAEWGVFRASDVGAPHRRARLFILAHADGVRFARACADVAGCEDGDASSGDVSRRRGAPLADADREHVRELPGRQRRTRGSGAPVPRGRGEGMADPLRAGRSRSGPALEERAGLADGHRSEGAGKLKSRVGRSAHGLSTGLDQWPAGPGEAQHDRSWFVTTALGRHIWPAPPGAGQFSHEPPRAVAVCANRPARLRALGNSVVPACAELAWRTLYARVSAAEVA